MNQLSPKTFSLLDRFLMWWLSRVGVWMYGGTSVPVLEEGFKTLGARGYFQYLGVAFKIITALQKRFGEKDAQFLIGLSAMWLGCAFCGYNHVYGGVLLHFKEKGERHPIHPHVMDKLFDMRDEEAMAHIQELLAGDDHAQLREMSKRMYQLFKRERAAQDNDDELLESCLWVWRWTTECTIIAGVEIQPEDAWPIHEIGRDKQVIARYREYISSLSDEQPN